MNTKIDQLTKIVLEVFSLSGLLLDWGNHFAEPHGLTSSRWQMLGALDIASKPLSVPQIGTAMGVSRQNVQKQINFLFNEGLVEKIENPSKKRSPLYQLTEQGEKAYSDIENHWQQHVNSLSCHFITTELDTTVKVLAAMINIHNDIPGGEL